MLNDLIQHSEYTPRREVHNPFKPEKRTRHIGQKK